MSGSEVTVRPKSGASRGVEHIGGVLPASKSHVQRALLSMGIATGPKHSGNTEHSGAAPSKRRVLSSVFGLDARSATQDILVTTRVLQALGADLRIDSAGGTIEIVSPARLDTATTRDDGPLRVNCVENGTCARMLGAILGTLDLHRDVILTGAAPLRRRPMGSLVEYLERIGVGDGRAGGSVGHEDNQLAADGFLPIRIERHRHESVAGHSRWPSEIVVDAETTTQVASGVMVGLALRKSRMPLRVQRPRARDYLEVTRVVLGETLGVVFDRSELDGDWVYQARRDAPQQHDPRWSAPSDASAVAFPAALSKVLSVPLSTSLREAIADGPADGHPDWAVPARLMAWEDSDDAASGDATIVENGLGAHPDGFPALCVAAALRRGRTILRGAPALRHKECDRIAAMARVLRAIGVDTEEFPDGLEIVGGVGAPRTKSVHLELPEDHRIVMASALLGASSRVFDPTSRAGLRLSSRDAVGKSWPGFWDWLADYAELEVCPG